MADVAAVQVVKHSQQLPHHSPQFILALRAVVCRVGERQVFHHQEGRSLLSFYVEGLVVTDRWMVHLSQSYEVPLNGWDVFLLDPHFFDRIAFS